MDKVLTSDFKTIGNVRSKKPRMSATDVNVYYGDKHAIQNVSLDVGEGEVLAMIGPSGCGKSTFLRTLNRMNDTIDSCRVTGDIRLDGEDIYDDETDPVLLRARVGMVFQKPNPFPNRFTTISPMDPVFMAWPQTMKNSMKLLKPV